MKRAALVVAVVLIMGTHNHVAAQPQALRVLVDSLNVRSGPDSAYNVIGTIHRDQVYMATEESSGYHKIWYNRSRGWVHDDSVGLTSTSYDDVFKGTNVRSGPSSSYEKVGYAKTGSKWAVITTSSSGNWHMVFYEGKQCWFYAKNRATTEEYTAPEEPVAVIADEAVRIVVAQSTLRSGPGVGYDPVGDVFADQLYMATESFDGWRKIWYSRSEGWIPEYEVTVESAEYDVVDWDWLNVRTGPATSYTKITSVPAGTKWVIVGYEGAWHQIYFEAATYWFYSGGVTTFDFIAPDGASPSPTSSDIGFMKLPASGPGFVRRCGVNNPDHAWGTPMLINGFLAATEAWEADHPDYPKIRVGDISLPNGGQFDSHVTHQNGTDADLFLLRTDASNEGAADIYDPAYSSERTREWITDYLTVHLPEVLSAGILLSDPNIFGKLTTVSSTEVCPAVGCPLDASGDHVLPSASGLSYVRCKARHQSHMQVKVE